MLSPCSREMPGMCLPLSVACAALAAPKSLYWTYATPLSSSQRRLSTWPKGSKTLARAALSLSSRESWPTKRRFGSRPCAATTLSSCMPAPCMLPRPLAAAAASCWAALALDSCASAAPASPPRRPASAPAPPPKRPCRAPASPPRSAVRALLMPSMGDARAACCIDSCRSFSGDCGARANCCCTPFGVAHRTRSGVSQPLTARSLSAWMASMAASQDEKRT
mmetsp:Transcript_76038/g.246237  ORF Transcript_76038/g.246237 Transcript_76038/m.246237 type:complete len:222 (-) Transcript_76038:1082-1747(-)